jgi:hypothetical protein
MVRSCYPLLKPTLPLARRTRYFIRAWLSHIFIILIIKTLFMTGKITIADYFLSIALRTTEDFITTDHLPCMFTGPLIRAVIHSTIKSHSVHSARNPTRLDTGIHHVTLYENFRLHHSHMVVWHLSQSVTKFSGSFPPLMDLGHIWCALISSELKQC